MGQEANQFPVAAASLDAPVTLSRDICNRAVLLSLAVHFREAENTSLWLIVDLYLMLNINWFLIAILAVLLQCNISPRGRKRQTSARIFHPEWSIYAFDMR